MALERGKLSDVVQVSAGTTQAMITVASSKKVYIKSIICHASGTGITTATGQVYFVPNGSSATASNKIFDVDIAPIGQEYLCCPHVTTQRAAM